VTYKLIHGDCLEELKKMPDHSVDSVVTDPPYGLSQEPDIREVLEKWLAGEDYHHRGGGFMGKTWDSFVPGPAIWREVYRVLKPGGHALVFAGTRTQDLMTTALRLAGFEIRDVVEWLYFSGFPKSLDVGKAFDKRKGGASFVHEFAKLIKKKRLEKGYSLAFMDKEVCGGTTNYSWFEGRPAGVRLPQLKEYYKIKELLDLDDTYDEMMEEAEREKIGERQKLDTFVRKGGYVAGEADASQYDKKVIDITAPATDLAKKWSGWGTALKPSHEPIIYAHKPFNSVPFSGIMEETTSLLEVALCLLLSSVNGAERIFRLSPSELNGESDFAVMSAALLHGERSGELKELMVTFNSPETVLTCLNIATLWNNILEESLKNGSMFTTKTETSLTTALKTLKSLLFPITQEPTIKAVMTAHGFGLNVSSAERNLNDEGRNTSDILKRFVAMSATLRTGENGTPANIAVNALRLITPSVVSVLKHVLTEIQTNNAEKSPLEPAHEPIIMVRKPLDGTVADNVERWRTGAINIDACRVGDEERINQPAANKPGGNALMMSAKGMPQNAEARLAVGRFPANCVTTEPDAFFSPYFNVTPEHLCKKASKRDRNSDWRGEEIGATNRHPTVKPTDLMAWLVRLVTPPGGVVLDPFAGSGSTLVAARREGFGFIGIEREAEYIEIAEARTVIKESFK